MFFTFSAGSMSLILRGDETVYVLSKGVSVKTSKYTINASHGLYYENSGIVRLYKADITSASLEMRADSLYYRKKDEYLSLSGNAYFEDIYRKVSGRKIVAKGDSAWAVGNVRVESKTKGVIVEGDSAFYWGKEAFGYVLGNAHSVVPSRDTLDIYANTFILHKDTTFGIGDVRAKSNSFKAVGDTFRATLSDTLLKNLLIVGNAKVDWKNGWGTSKKVEITFKDGYIEYVIFEDSARVVYKEGGGTIDVSGKLIKAYSESDTLKHILVEELFEGVYR